MPDTSRDQRAAFTSLGHWFEAEKFRAFQPDLFQAVMMSPTVKEARPLARLGYYDYTSVTDIFEMRIPNASPAEADGLEGAPA